MRATGTLFCTTTVKPGDRVKKNQVLITLDADEPRADVRAKKAAVAAHEAALARLRAHPYKEEQAEARAALDSALVTALEAREVLERIMPLIVADGRTCYAFELEFSLHRMIRLARSLKQTEVM